MNPSGTRRTARDTWPGRVKQLIGNVTEALRGYQKEREPGFARISLWNNFFKDYPLYVVADPGQHFVDILRRHYLRATDATRFCFEIALWLIDLPEYFHQLASMFPVQYTIAMHIAFKILHEHIEPPAIANASAHLVHVVKEVPKEDWQHILDYIKGCSGSMLQLDSSLTKLRGIVSPYVLDIVLCVLPAPLRIHYAMRFGRPVPQVLLDYENLELPFEFIEAISDIEGENVLDKFLGGQ